jgi:hypothetical protein
MEDGMERACGNNRRYEKCIQTFCFKDLKGLHHSEHLGIEEKVILKWILGKKGWKVRTGFIWLRTGTGEHGIASVGSIKDKELLYQLKELASQE